MNKDTRSRSVSGAIRYRKKKEASGEWPIKPVLEQVSVTELSSFRECRRRWYLGTVRGLVARRGTKEALWFGDLMHTGLQAYADKGVSAAIKAFRAAYAKGIEEVARQYGGLWEGVEELYREYEDLGVGMLTNYAIFDEAQGMKMDTIHLEQRVWVPIRDLSGQPLPGSPKLTARMDRVVWIDKKEDHYIIDYKTGSSLGTGKALELNDQATGYEYMHWRLTSELAAGVVFEKLMKVLPDDPRMIRDGKELSTAKNQNTLPDLYEAKMKELDLMQSAKHLECLEALRAQGWDGYFEREITTRNFEQVLNFEKHLYYIYTDMAEVVKNPEKAYPSPSSMRCPRCQFISVCLAMEDGSDAESMIENQFDVNLERRW